MIVKVLKLKAFSRQAACVPLTALGITLALLVNSSNSPPSFKGFNIDSYLIGDTVKCYLI